MVTHNLIPPPSSSSSFKRKRGGEGGGFGQLLFGAATIFFRGCFGKSKKKKNDYTIFEKCVQRRSWNAGLVVGAAVFWKMSGAPLLIGEMGKTHTVPLPQWRWSGKNLWCMNEGGRLGLACRYDGRNGSTWGSEEPKW